MRPVAPCGSDWALTRPSSRDAYFDGLALLETRPAGRTDGIWNLDLRLAYSIRLRGDDLRLELRVVIFNVTNQQLATQVDEG